MSKKSKRNEQGKPSYGLKVVKGILDEGNKAIAGGGAPEDPWLFVAAAHALDLHDVAADSKQGLKLDFTVQTQGDVLPATMISMMMLKSQGKTEAEARQTVAKRIAAYMMFQVYSDLVAAGDEAAFDCSESSYALVAKTGDGGELRYDFLAAAIPAVNRFVVGGPASGLFGGGTLQPFYQDLAERFIIPLAKSKGVTDEMLGSAPRE